MRGVNIKYRAGRENKNADALSWWPHLSAPEVGIAEDEAQVSITVTKKGEVKQSQAPSASKYTGDQADPCVKLHCRECVEK